MSSTIFLTLGRRTVMLARPATYGDLLGVIRRQFPRVSSVYNIAVVFQPARATGDRLQNWVQVDESAYGAVHGGAELHINVAHPLSKEYILPLPGEQGSNHHNHHHHHHHHHHHYHHKQVPRTDGAGNRASTEDGDLNAAAGGKQGSPKKTRGASYRFENSSLSLELGFPGGDAFSRGWGGASERFRQSAKLVPNLKDCKEAIGQAVVESNLYPEDEYERTANSKPGTQQQQNQPTLAGWDTGPGPGQGNANLVGDTEAQHPAGGLEGDEDEGKKHTFYPNYSNRSRFAASPIPQSFRGTPPPSDRGRPLPTTPQWDATGRDGEKRGGDRTPSATGWILYQGQEGGVPHHVRSRDSSPIDAGAEHCGQPQGGWDLEQNEMHVADQGYSRIAASQSGQTGAGHLANGNRANGYPAAHPEVSHYSHHQVQPDHGASGWSPPRHQSDGDRQAQGPWGQGYPPGPPISQSFAGPRPRRDPGEVTYGSPRPRIQGGATGWTPIGRKRNARASNLAQEQRDAEPCPDAANSRAWYGQSPPPNHDRTAGQGGASRHRGFARHVSHTYRQKEGRGPARSWGSDFWGGPPPNRAQRGSPGAQDATPASRHWQ